MTMLTEIERAEPRLRTRAGWSHLDALEAESIFILREVAAECRNVALLFSGGKDSATVLRLAERAFFPERIPFTLLHIDTEHNFPEVIAFRDKLAAERGLKLVVRSVGESIRTGRVRLRRPDEPRNPHQSVTLLDAIAEFGFDACIGGARRDEEKARAKERMFSFRDEFGQWDPKNQRPELWSIYNGRTRPGENIRVFPDLELDRARCVAIHPPRGHRLARDLFRASPRRGATGRRAGAGDRGYPASRWRASRGAELCASAPSATSPARRRWSPLPRLSMRSSARRARRAITERGATRLDDQTNDAAMELRKKEGYF